jgi:DNA-directed RNA polymerase subunit N (RpoN/RPB10)
MRIEQSAGSFVMITYTDGAPVTTQLTVNDGSLHRSDTQLRLSLNDLHDLRYCCDRMIAQIEASGLK